jgi:hypothetical protein
MKKLTIFILSIALFGLSEAMERPTYYYDILGIEPNATLSDISQAYREKSKEYHPDSKNVRTGKIEKDFATERFKELSEAHEIFSNSEARYTYDHEGIKLARDVLRVQQQMISHIDGINLHIKAFEEKINNLATIDELEKAAAENYEYYKAHMAFIMNLDIKEQLKTAVLTINYKLTEKMYDLSKYVQAWQCASNVLPYLDIQDPLYDAFVKLVNKCMDVPLSVGAVQIESDKINPVEDNKLKRALPAARVKPKTSNKRLKKAEHNKITPIAELNHYAKSIQEKNKRVEEYLTHISLIESKPSPGEIYDYIIKAYQNVASDFENISDTDQYKELEKSVLQSCYNASKLLVNNWYLREYSLNALQHANFISNFVLRIPFTFHYDDVLPNIFSRLAEDIHDEKMKYLED